MKKIGKYTSEVQIDKLEALTWAVDFMEKYEKREENKRRVERIKREDDGR